MTIYRALKSKKDRRTSVLTARCYCRGVCHSSIV